MSDNREPVDHPAPESSSHFSCVPVPSWASHEPWPDEPPEPPGDCIDNGVLRVLYDAQTSLLQPGVACHVRVVQRVLSRAGAERAAHVGLEFDPANDRLEIHFVRVWRDGECTDKAHPDAFQILRRETQLERLALNGRLTATLLIDDLRVDDRLEIACTLFSANTVLAGRFSGWLIFNGFAPSIETRQRVIRPRHRRLNLKAYNSPPQAIVESDGDIEDSRWSIKGQKRLLVEELSPAWTVKNPCYELTEFERWGDVAGLFERYYRDDSLPVGVTSELDRLAASYSSKAERAVEWLRFVQRELRYFALSLGEGGLVPRPLDEIWNKRFGDCKDAARLYVAGARHLGIDACAALVSTAHGLSLGDFLPAPHAFNHVTVRVRVGGVAYWLDPTMQPQAGSLDQIALMYAGSALPLETGVTGLEQLPTSEPLQHIRCEDTIQFGPKPESPATLRRSIRLAFWTADTVRNQLAGEGLSKLSSQQLRELQSVWRSAKETEPMTVRDDPVNNQLEVVGSYEIHDCWTRSSEGKLGFNIADAFTVKELAALKDTRREGDIQLGRPRSALWRAHLHMPRRWGGTGWSQVLDEPGIRFSSELSVGKDVLTLGRQLRIDAWSLSAARSEGYAEIITKLTRNVTTLWGRERFGKLVSPASGPLALIRKGLRLRPLLYAVYLFCVFGGILASSQWFTGSSTVDQSAVNSPTDSAGDRLLTPAHRNGSDTPKDYCVQHAQNNIGVYFENNCSETVKVRVVYSTIEDAEEFFLTPGGRYYVRDSHASAPASIADFAACPSSDEIVGSAGESWAAHGSPFTCLPPR